MSRRGKNQEPRQQQFTKKSRLKLVTSLRSKKEISYYTQRKRCC